MRSLLVECLKDLPEQNKIDRLTDVANQVVSLRRDAALETHTFETRQNSYLKLIFIVR